MADIDPANGNALPWRVKELERRVAFLETHKADADDLKSVRVDVDRRALADEVKAVRVDLDKRALGRDVESVRADIDKRALGKDLDLLREDFKSVRVALYTLATSIAVAAVIFALTILGS
jgi:hypothetical protein